MMKKIFFGAIAFFALANFAFASDVNFTENTNVVIGGVTLVIQNGSGAQQVVVNASSIDVTLAGGDILVINSPSLREISLAGGGSVTCTGSDSSATLSGVVGTITVTLGPSTCSGGGSGPGPGPAPDTTPPTVYAGAPTGVLPTGTTQTTVSLTTDESATCKYATSTGVSYYAMVNTFSTTGSTNHSQLVTGLTGGSSYNYYVRCSDGSGNVNSIDYPISFSVDTFGADLTIPTTPAGLSSTAISDIQINLSWSSSTDNILVSGYYVYRDGAQLTSTSNINYQDGSLTPGTTYSYYVVAYDSSGNRSASSTPSSATTSVTPVTCSTFTYSAWGDCEPGNVQTRTVLTSSPSGCSGGSPVTDRSCTYVAVIVCGDSVCSSPSETCSNCSLDCGVCAPPPPPPSTPPSVTPPPSGGANFCGDGSCSGGENCSNCSSDCGACAVAAVCGDGTCSSSESCTSCSSDCGECPPKGPSAVVNVVNNITEGLNSALKSLGGAISSLSPQQVKEVAQKTKEVASEPAVQVAAETAVGVATAVGVSQGLLGTIFTQIPAASDILLVVVRTLGLVAEFLGIRKRTKKWGVVYDAQTKRPLDPAYVTIYDAQGKEIESKVTDMDGRFGFLVGSGAYKMVAHKTNYAFPATTISGTTDDLYDTIYKGELIEINNPDILKLNIPMDPVGVDWNEQIKKKIMSFNPKKEIFFKKFASILFWVGLVLSPVMYWAIPSKLNLGILVSYLVLAGLRTVGFKARNYGRIYDKVTGKPVPFAKIKVFLRIPGLPEQRLLTAVTDVTGRYYILVVGKGDYVLNVSGTAIDGRQITTEVPVNVKERVINFDLSV